MNSTTERRYAARWDVETRGEYHARLRATGQRGLAAPLKTDDDYIVVALVAEDHAVRIGSFRDADLAYATADLHNATREEWARGYVMADFEAWSAEVGMVRGELFTTTTEEDREDYRFRRFRFVWGDDQGEPADAILKVGR